MYRIGDLKLIRGNPGFPDGWIPPENVTGYPEQEVKEILGLSNWDNSMLVGLTEIHIQKFVKSACTYHKNSNHGKLELTGNLNLHGKMVKTQRFAFFLRS